ncbi:hypothetical protein QP858_06680 [Trueperella bernardiae]|uniref:Uncharacterized protein n=1 Tax=Trueperella bernardiae TaxID=59561 RepID=A0AAW6ZN59_9ACTO|nr:hypothetical protein [Trueperella bernardiae]MDK8602138.1 hypothetical protein [Trueperella bernardiae]
MSTSTKVKRRTRSPLQIPAGGPERRAYTYAFKSQIFGLKRTATSHSMEVA